MMGSGKFEWWINPGERANNKSVGELSSTGRCARAVSGHVAAPVSPAVKSHRLINE
jgi:hypothetical protein